MLIIKQEGPTAGVGPCFHLPGAYLGTGFLPYIYIYIYTLRFPD